MVKEEKEWLSQKTCPVCGKKFTVLYPELWAYRDRSVSYSRFLCSWKCLRADEEKGKKMFKAITGEQKKKAVQIALEGGKVLGFLRDDCGCKNPNSIWYEIKKKLMQEDPETYERLPEKYKLKKAAEGKAKGEDALDPKETARMLFGEDAAKQIYPEDGDEMPEDITADPGQLTIHAAEPHELLVTAVKDKVVGEFYWDEKYSTMDWRTPEGDEVSLWPEKWWRLLEILPDVMKVLGVKGK